MDLPWYRYLRYHGTSKYLRYQYHSIIFTRIIVSTWKSMHCQCVMLAYTSAQINAHKLMPIAQWPKA